MKGLIKKILDFSKIYIHFQFMFLYFIFPKTYN